jgi:hypothetical protein
MRGTNQIQAAAKRVKSNKGMNQVWLTIFMTPFMVST